jgi:hypothetical protein
MRSSGTRITCSGTTVRPSSTASVNPEPRNRILASAKPATVPIETVTETLGSVMSRLFMNARPSPPWDSTST